MDVDYTAYLQGSLVLDADGQWWHEGVKFKNEKLALFFHHAIQYCPEDKNFYVVVGRQRALFTFEDTALFVVSYSSESKHFTLNNNLTIGLDNINFKSSRSVNALYISFDLNNHSLLAKFTRACYQSIIRYVSTEDMFCFEGVNKPVMTT